MNLKKNWIYFTICLLIFILLPGGLIISAWMAKKKLEAPKTTVKADGGDTIDTEITDNETNEEPTINMA